MTLALAFYRGRGRWDDCVIRAVTRSPFAHVELTEWPGRDGPGDAPRPSLSASGRDGGVRLKQIAFKGDRWTFVQPMPWAPADAWHRAAAEIGAGYDYRGILMTFAVPLRRQHPDRWFCSELCAHALGLPDPHTYAPGDLYHWVRALNAAWHKGRMMDH
jgi:hypothetical protein